jgi:hypothetical protein
MTFARKAGLLAIDAFRATVAMVVEVLVGK